MDPIIGAAAISAGANILGGIFGRKGAEDQNRIAQQTAERNIALQKEFAQSGIQWKVADAKAAGIHPLYALGASTQSFAPVSVGTVNEGAPMADMAKNLGQDLSRAAYATQTGSQRALAGEITAIQMDGLKLDNEIKRAELASKIQRLKQQTGPAMPGTVGDTGPVSPFTVGEDKPEANPPMMIGGQRVPADHGWSPAKVASDRWGDESFATNMYGNLRALRDLYHLYGVPAWDGMMARRNADHKAMQEWSRKFLAPNLDPRYRGFSHQRH